MWACRASPSRVIGVPRPVNTKPSRIFFVSAKFQPRRSRRQNTNYNYNHYDADDDEDAVQVTPLSTEPEETFGSSHYMPEKTEKQDQVPTGSDILRALQRATVRKHNKKKKQQQQLRAVPDSKAKKDMVSTISVIGNDDTPVKPLRIRSDWSTRLDELEMRLQDLLHI